MQLAWDQVRPGTSNPFGAAFSGTLLDSPNLYFQSEIPDVQTLEALAFADPGSLANTYADFRSALTDFDKVDALGAVISDLAMATQAVALRNTVGTWVQSFGVRGNEFQNVSNLCVQQVSSVVDVARAVSTGEVDAEVVMDAFAAGANALAYSNPYGWIVALVVNFGRKVADVVIKEKDAASEGARRQVSAQFAVPRRAVTEVSETSDERLAQQMFERMLPLSTYNPMAIATPAYLPSGGGIGWVAVPVKNDPDDLEELPNGWVTHPGEATGGLGLVPGTGNLRRPLFLPMAYKSATKSNLYGCASGPIRDMGTLYPTATGMASFWWRHMFSSKIAPLTLDCDALIALWIEAMQSDFELARNLTEGWSCVASAPGYAFGHTFKCFGKTPNELAVADRGLYGVGDCRKARRGNVVEIPPGYANSHHTQVLRYFYKLYFGYDGLANWRQALPLTSSNPKTYSSDRGGGGTLYPNPDQLDYELSVPVQALRNLQARQNAILLSRDAFYVNGENTPDGAGLFPAFKSNAMRQAWAQNITTLFESGDWKGVAAADVPRGTVRELLFQKAKSIGYDDPERDFNAPCPPGAPAKCFASQFTIQAPSVLGDPKLPDAPPVNDFLPDKLASEPVRRGGAGGGGLALFAGAAALAGGAWWLSRRR